METLFDGNFHSMFNCRKKEKKLYSEWGMEVVSESFPFVTEHLSNEALTVKTNDNKWSNAVTAHLLCVLSGRIQRPATRAEL